MKVALCTFVALQTLTAASTDSTGCGREILDKALANHSSSPSYVLITAVIGAMGRRATTCIPAPALLIAIRDELGLAEDAGSNAKAEQFAREVHGTTFHFGTHRAWKRVTPLYSKEILADVERRVAGLSDEELRNGLARPNGSLHLIYREAKDWPAYRDALAHVLLKRCVAVRLVDQDGGLALEP